MSALDDLFNSPPRPRPVQRRTPSPARSGSRSLSPVSLSGEGVRRTRNGQESLFLSPGGESNYDSSSRRDRNRHQNRNQSGSASRSRSRSPNLNLDTRNGRDSSSLPLLLPNGQNDLLSKYTSIRGDNIDDAAFQDPSAGLNDPLALGGDGDDDGDGAGGAKKRRRVMAKVDADRLTSDRGFPALCRAAKKFKVHGKGRETQDLRSLLNMYQMWAHGMFPKGDFAHTINRVEVVCRTRRMESAMRGYREAFYPRPRTPSPPPFIRALSDGPLTPPEYYLPDSESGPQEPEPLFASRREDDDEAGDPDLEEMMALEEMEREAGQVQDKANVVPPDDGPPVLEEEDEWEGLYD
ncbi:hypothetical protein IAR55_005203 [Kwoniella newhampshirensis]|uniref:Chromosome segregation in meiosis protein n=1 Tax=Kwoniella newhampshirensis TaxID=1651941 RepID=A0AAW0YK97_9TREE